jgi:hypothetical protein
MGESMIINNQTINLQLDGLILKEDFTFTQGDSKVNTFTIHVYDGTTEITYASASSAIIVFNKPDGTTVVGDMTVGASSITYTLGTNEIASPGNVTVSVQLEGTNGERLTCQKFRFEVLKDPVSSSSIESTTEFTVLQSLIGDVNEALEKVENIGGGNSYSGSTEYSKDNTVTDQGGYWIYINETASTGNAPPTLPTTSNAYWKLIAAPGEDGVDSYVYVAYASDSSGTGFSLTPTNALKYRAEIHVTTSTPSPQASDFTGATWVKYLGSDGSGVGDMLKETYDPSGIEGDAFDMANMKEAANAKIMTAVERTAIVSNTAGISLIRNLHKTLSMGGMI